MSETIGDTAAADSCKRDDVKEEVKLNTETAAAGEPGIAPVDKAPQVEEKSEEAENDGGDQLQLKLQEKTKQCDDYKKKLEETEAKFAALQASYDAITSGKDDEVSLRKQIEELKNNLSQAETKLNDRSRLITTQECQIGALAKQISSLKEVVAITKNLLEIRNIEVKHLQEDVNSMESKIAAERTRHDEMINRMNATAKLNADLKTEYETQLRLFQDLRKKYEEKVSILTDAKASNSDKSCSK